MEKKQNNNFLKRFYIPVIIITIGILVELGIAFLSYFFKK